VSNQTVQRDQRSPRSQWPTDSARHRSWETDPARLRGLGDRRLQATDEELRDALNGQPLPLHRKLLTLYRQRLDLIEGQVAELESRIAEAMKAHQDAVVRLSQLPGLGITAFFFAHTSSCVVDHTGTAKCPTPVTLVTGKGALGNQTLRSS
jgi:transposase